MLNPDVAGDRLAIMNAPRKNPKDNPSPGDVVPNDEEYYSPTLSPDPDEVTDEDNDQNPGYPDESNQGGTIDENHTVNEDSGAVTPGTPGHPGVDEGTD